MVVHRQEIYMKLQLWSNPRRSGHLGEAAAVLGQDAGVGTLQFPDDLKALVELGEDVDHGAGEQSVLRRLLELTHERRVIIVSNHRSALLSLQRPKTPVSLLHLFCLAPGRRA